MNSYDHVRKIVQEEGRTARNLVLYNVPVRQHTGRDHLTIYVLFCITSKSYNILIQVRTVSQTLSKYFCVTSLSTNAQIGTVLPKKSSSICIMFQSDNTQEGTASQSMSCSIYINIPVRQHTGRDCLKNFTTSVKHPSQTTHR